MREIEYKPELCSKPESGVTGHIKVKVPSLDAKYEYMEKAGMEIGMDGEVKPGGNLIKAVRFLVGAAKDHIVEVKLKTKEGDLSSYDEMMYDSSGQDILQEVALKLMHGFGPGNG